MAKDSSERRDIAQARADSSEQRSELTPTDHWLGRSLHRMYDEALREPLPDSLVELLEELRRREGQQS